MNDISKQQIMTLVMVSIISVVAVIFLLKITFEKCRKRNKDPSLQFQYDLLASEEQKQCLTAPCLNMVCSKYIIKRRTEIDAQKLTLEQRCTMYTMLTQFLQIMYTLIKNNVDTSTLSQPYREYLSTINFHNLAPYTQSCLPELELKLRILITNMNHPNPMTTLNDIEDKLFQIINIGKQDPILEINPTKTPLLSKKTQSTDLTLDTPASSSNSPQTPASSSNSTYSPNTQSTLQTVMNRWLIKHRNTAYTTKPLNEHHSVIEKMRKLSTMIYPNHKKVSTSNQNKIHDVLNTVSETVYYSPTSSPIMTQKDGHQRVLEGITQNTRLPNIQKSASQRLEHKIYYNHCPIQESREQDSYPQTHELHTTHRRHTTQDIHQDTKRYKHHRNMSLQTTIPHNKDEFSSTETIHQSYTPYNVTELLKHTQSNVNHFQKTQSQPLTRRMNNKPVQRYNTKGLTKKIQNDIQNDILGTIPELFTSQSQPLTRRRDNSHNTPQVQQDHYTQKFARRQRPSLPIDNAPSEELPIKGRQDSCHQTQELQNTYRQHTMQDMHQDTQVPHYSNISLPHQGNKKNKTTLHNEDEFSSTETIHQSYTTPYNVTTLHNEDEFSSTETIHQSYTPYNVTELHTQSNVNHLQRIQYQPSTNKSCFHQQNDVQQSIKIPLASHQQVPHSDNVHGKKLRIPKDIAPENRTRKTAAPTSHTPHQRLQSINLENCTGSKKPNITDVSSYM
ncbi:MAG: hypothetical protein P857_725 [Candidatus Xenolissoclinum pacificiensis L6]|uniref:Uncharacterized protein n=1 Tax=Candidatus Xenolissoclinum pacificiensis L6 TaxID=1401685 RepID=W2V0S1_9RICK|nr:MAG: hypothetical protein P857_725 [Candidatus Xenolissoclinum pacificiensis L6]